LYNVILIMALVVFVLVEFCLVWILIRDRKQQGDDTPPKQVYANAKLEITWTVIPVLLTGVLFVLTVRTMDLVAAPAPSAADINVHVIGHQWFWEIDYSDLGIKTANELHIPLGATVQITLDSIDVIHSFWIPQLSGKTDVIPGQTNQMWLTADQTGVFLGQCAEFCGIEHALMRIEVVVDSQEDFNAWVSNQQKPAAQPQTDEEQEGFKQVTGLCASCHSINPAEPENKVGPNLAHLFSRSKFAGATYDLTEENLSKWLHDTQPMKPGNKMNLKLTPEEIEHLLAYLKLLK
ncbi:MAG TPA: cytochrome c oxidase subunit II, partial [Anaerolineales bacterium]|nr:cytochrome c oxidase subunit II [Anaerolineales bacterium]